VGHEHGDSGIHARLRFTHLTHHRLNLTKEDVEGRHAQMPGWRALLNGPYFTLLMHMTALRHGGRRLGVTVAAQLLVNAICIALIFRFGRWDALRYHVIAMGVGHCLTAFFAYGPYTITAIEATISPERCVIGS